MVDAIELIPEIADDDIDWVAGVMGLEGLDEPRRAFLKSRSTLDLAACPGSGKTTLIVAKLAMLARKWPHRAKGICVLSHTNVAREEIQRCLGDTIVGQRLLAYPHCIDTIHGFVNRFLTLPWLNSNGFPSPTIDDDVATAHRRSVLENREYWTVENFLRQKYSGFDKLRICGRNLEFDIGGKAFPAGSGAQSFQLARRAVEAAARAGYFCYDEIFVWARALIEDFPGLPGWLACRFPLVLIDEMQDTSEAQGGLLHSVFGRESQAVVVQRVGDSNQAIFDRVEREAGRQDPFPDGATGRRLELPNSYRFGPQIAALASRFAATAVGANGLRGVGPQKAKDAAAGCRHGILIFSDDNIAGVLPAYARHVLATFVDAQLQEGIVAAVGAVHQDAPDVAAGNAQYPKTVPHYWSSYTTEIGRKEHPTLLAQYVRAAQKAVVDTGELSAGVDKIASGLCRLAGLIGDSSRLGRRSRSHRAVVEALNENPAALSSYRTVLTASLINRAPLTEEVWRLLQEHISTAASALCTGSVDMGKGEAFRRLAVADLSAAPTASGGSDTEGANVYRLVDGERRVDIRVGSIHSVKGQTHLATLVLNTFWHDHFFGQLLPWLLGIKCNRGRAGVRDLQRLLQAYVAMTRPTHLLCLAIPRSILGDDAKYAEHSAAFIAQGWAVGDVAQGAASWRR